MNHNFRGFALNVSGFLSMAILGIAIPSGIILLENDVNAQESNSTYVKLDKQTYTWTDKVYITIYSPSNNLHANLIEEIGNTLQHQVKISTKNHVIENYKLVETGPDTGIFAGEVTLSGFLHDADGSGRYADSNEGYDTDPKTSGTGPTDGFLQSENNDTILVLFETLESENFVDSALIQWNMGEIQWLQGSYPDSATGIVQVIDPDMNWNPEKVDNFFVDVWSDSDAGGIDLIVTETNENSGIFEGTVFFSTTDESSGHRLRTVEGDTITAEYEDNTLPNPYTPKDELDITDTAIIRNTTVPSPYKQMKNGVIAEHVICNGTLEKIYKSDGNPSCVKPSSVEKLIQRGWTDNFTDVVSANNNQKQIILQSESLAYEDLCGFPVTEKMHLKAIYDNSHRFTREGVSYFELYPGNFTHITLAENYLPDDPHLNYWFDLKNGKQMYFRIGACDVDGSDISRYEVRG